MNRAEIAAEHKTQRDVGYANWKKFRDAQVTLEIYLS